MKHSENRSVPAAAFAASPEAVATPKIRPSTTALRTQPPRAAAQPVRVRSPHGSRDDPYHWLRDDTRSRLGVLQHLQAENAYYAAMTAHTRPLRETLYRELLGQLDLEQATVPVRYRRYDYYSRYRPDSDYPLYLRRQAHGDAPEQVLLDGDALAAGHAFFEIGGFSVSPDERLLAYTTDTVGRRQFALRFRNLDDGSMLPDAIPATQAAVAWADDNRTVFYVENDPVTLLGVRVKRHRIGRDPRHDVTVYEETDHSFYLSVRRSGDERYLLIDAQSTVASELRYLRANRPHGQWRVLARRKRGVEYRADHIGRRWIVRTNWKARNFRIVQVSDQHAGDRRRWRGLVAPRKRVYIAGFALFRRFLVLSERCNGLQRIRVRRWRDGEEYLVASDEDACSVTLGENRVQATDVLRYESSSLVTPRSVYELDMRTGVRVLRKRDSVPNYDPADYVSERIRVTARDGTAIPVSLLYRRGLRRNGTAPLYQHAYGAYGVSDDPQFSAPRLSLVDRGFVYAIAHVRGGSEMGRSWYEDGKLLRKKNTFTDFIDVTRALVAAGYVARDKVFAEGGSAGGLLVAAVANMAPQDYRGIIAHVPFVDVVTTMLDERIPLTSNELDEWGNPAHAHHYEYMLSYSPYDNVRAQAYPAMLVTTGLWDSQVQYYEPVKWVAKLRARKTDTNPLLLRIDMHAGHAGRSGRHQRYREAAEEFAFVLGMLGTTRRRR